MKVVAINSSPNKGQGNTALILNPLLEGLQQAGAEVELFHTRELSVNPCQGEFNCWLKTPGRCFQQDDMQWLGPKLWAADVWVLASPVYIWGLSGPMKNLLDRIIPSLEPFFTLLNGHCSHPLRPDIVSGKKIVLVSSCGLWEMDNFDPLVVQFQTMCRIAGFDFAGALLRPHGWVLPAMLGMGGAVSDVLAAAKEAGRELVASGRIPAETLKTVSRPLVSLEQCIELANRHFQGELDKLQNADKHRVMIAGASGD